MNKKFFAGILTFGVVATFWACGSGDIITPDEADKVMAVPGAEGIGLNPDPELIGKYCPECLASVPSSSSKAAPVKPSSSSMAFPVSSADQPLSSSWSFNLSSSSKNNPFPYASSSSMGPQLPSSSSVIVNPSGGGSCAPVKAIVEQGEKVIWTYTFASPVSAGDLLKATFKWSTPGASPETLEKTGAGGKNDSVSYATSGQHTASLALSTQKGSFNFQCSPVQVNGSPITGCKCSTTATSVDFTATPEVSWSVTGCSTGTGLELKYEWDGNPDGATTYTKAFTEEHPGYVPKLRVSNNDNTVIEVTDCPAVKLTDGPEYKITMTQASGAIDLPKGSSNVVLAVDAQNNTVFCNVSRTDSPSGALNGSVNKVSLKGSDYIAVQLPAGTLVSGASLEFVLDVPAKCGVQ